MTCQVNSTSALTVLYLDLWDDSVLVVDERLQDVDDQFDCPIFNVVSHIWIVAPRWIDK